MSKASSWWDWEGQVGNLGPSPGQGWVGCAVGGVRAQIVWGIFALQPSTPRPFGEDHFSGNHFQQLCPRGRTLGFT